LLGVDQAEYLWRTMTGQTVTKEERIDIFPDFALRRSFCSVYFQWKFSVLVEGMERESGGDAGLRSFAIHEQLNLEVEELSEAQLVLR
jgi:hypothetical protein